MNTPLRTPFGSTPSGEQAERITLNNGTLSCGIITYGAILQLINIRKALTEKSSIERTSRESITWWKMLM